MAKSQKPKQVSASAKAVRRTRMLAKKLAGKSTTEIAQEEGISRVWATRELNSPECGQVITALVDEAHPQIRKLFTKILVAIEDGLKAKAVVNFQGMGVTLGPDHYARLTAVKRYLDVVSLGRPTARLAEDKRNRTLTLEEFERLIEENARKRVSVQ